MELVVGASEASMKSLLGKLGGLLAQEYALVRGVRGDVQYIYNELATMQAFLRDLSSAPAEQDHRMKDWMKQIRDMAYDCEDCIDDYFHRFPNDSFSHVKCSFTIQRIYEVWTWWPRHEIASNIASLKIRAQQIAERRGRYGVDNPSNCNGNSSGARAATYEIAEHQVTSRQLIGIKEPVGVTADMKELEMWVGRPDEEQAVLSIIGFGGVGKTTIATALYRKVSNKFDCRAWVNVSQNYDQEAVLRSILKQVMPQDRDQISQNKQGRDEEEKSGGEGSLEKKHLAAQAMNTLKRAVPFNRGHKQQGNDGISDEKQINIETMDTDKLVLKVKEHLKEKRYLLLIDDIWSAKTWESIRLCLPLENNKCSRVIVTSRFQAVGAACSSGTNNLLRTIEFLSAVESKNLFYQSVSESESRKRNEQAKIPEEIWKICGGCLWP
ncbi:unnamed protein product [Urochloa humidicola]